MKYIYGILLIALLWTFSGCTDKNALVNEPEHSITSKLQWNWVIEAKEYEDIFLQVIVCLL